VNLNYKDWDTGAVFFLSLKVTVGALALVYLGYRMSTRLPKESEILPKVLLEPVQSEVNHAPFVTTVKNISYQIIPKADYEITGLVVALHDSEFMDITHAASQDYINTHDICVIWGANSRNPFMSKIEFSHGDWTCYFQTKDNNAWKSFRKDQISNNHILPANYFIEKIISSVRVGDQIEMKGQLVDYKFPWGGVRKTSLVRDDVEDGACEVMYVTQAKILSRSSELWYLFKKAASFFAIMGALGMVFALFILPKFQKSTK
jgi:hypothetical protein